nr:PREDICTED: uncharacterized protein LOC100880738 [Megachile rotundata]
MENSEVTIEGENYEVVDECVEEEDTTNAAQNKSMDNSTNMNKQCSNDMVPENSTENKNIEQNNEAIPMDSVNDSVPDNSNINSSIEDNKSNIKNDESNIGNDKTNIENDQSNIENIENTNKNEQSNVGNEQSNAENEQSNAENEQSNAENEQSNTENEHNNIINDQNKIENDTEQSNVENEHPQQSNAESIDFTADINLDQLEEQKDVTDEDVLRNLDEIENIDLTSDVQVIKQNDQTQENRISNSEIKKIGAKNERVEKSNINQQIPDNNNENNKSIAVEEGECVKYEWYEKKLAEKEAIIKERLSKVARVLAISYPCYEHWLEWEEKMNGSPLCKLKPARRCRLDKPYTNRWKFICTKKNVQNPTKMTSDADSDGDNKNAEFMWKLEPGNTCGVNINNEVELPPFVLSAVKVFEDFLQTTEQLLPQNSKNESFSDDIPMDASPKKEVTTDGRQEWLWLLVRCNSMDELMLFATGKNISCSTMNRLKQIYESGPGKDCNVKSLYCKTINKCNDTVVTDTTFLVGSEALDETVGGLKIQLAPKTNFWSNTAGAENIANAVIELLGPTPKTTVFEIGCGIGLIGLMMASKCQQVIGVDSPSEVEEAEMTCELNNIKNASFIMGAPNQIAGKIAIAAKNRRTGAIINANTNIGRAIEIMACLRKIPSLKRIVMITTLTKQSVRAILELARPVDNSSRGPPFIPVLARVVDTLPVGPHFEAVIMLQRRTIKMNLNWYQKSIEATDSKNNQEQAHEQSTNGANKRLPVKDVKPQVKKNFNKPIVKHAPKKSKAALRRTLYTKNADNLTKNIFKGKRSHSPDKGEAPPKKLMKKFNKSGIKDLPAKRKKEWITENPQLRINPTYERKMREPKEQPDLRERLSNNRLDTDIAQTVKEHQALLEIAKEKLSGPAPTVDVNTAKQLQNMLNMVLEQTNKLQSQLPRSVWDRIAPPENVNSGERESTDDLLLKGRYIQEMGSQDILITATNKKFLNNEESTMKPGYKKYNNLPPLEPNTIMPVSQAIEHREERQFRVTPDRYEISMQPQQTQDIFNRNRWNEMGNVKKPMSPMRRQISPIIHRLTPPKRLSPKRPLLSPPRRPCSPPRRHFSPLRRPPSPIYRQRSPVRCEISPLRRPLSPPRRTDMPLNRPMSPLRRQISPPRQQISPMRSTMSPRRQPSPMRRPVSPPRRQIPSPNRMMSGRQEMLLSRRQVILQDRQQTSTMRREESSKAFMPEPSPSLSKRPQSPQRRQMSPQPFTDDWDIPSRGAIEQGTWFRPTERVSEQNVWRNDKNLASNSNWEQAACNDRQRKSFSQEKWDTKESVRSDSWNSSGNNWNSKQLPTKPMMKETWSSSFDNKWTSTPNMPGTSNENWNIRGKETFTTYKEPWMDSKKQSRWEPVNVKDSWKNSDKEDLNDLPEDAKDPWGDDGTSDFKDRWSKFENTPSSSTWTRENEQQGDMWSKNKANWQNKGSNFPTKSQWQNSNVQNVGKSRWLSQNDTEKKAASSGSWKSGNNVGSWQFQNSNFQSQRPFPTSQFKSSY